MPLVYVNHRRAIIAIEKGVPGERAFNEAFATWGENSMPNNDPPRIKTLAVKGDAAENGGVPAAGGGYLVQVSSEKNEADAQASYRALQTKFPSVLGSQSPVIKRVEWGDNFVYYRAMVGPFGTHEEAAQFCGKLKIAGGQCMVQIR